MQFSKMHGLGNDFMVVDAVTQNVFFSPELIRRLADRHLVPGWLYALSQCGLFVVLFVVFIIGMGMSA